MGSHLGLVVGLLVSLREVPAWKVHTPQTLGKWLLSGITLGARVEELSWLGSFSEKKVKSRLYEPGRTLKVVNKAMD